MARGSAPTTPPAAAGTTDGPGTGAGSTADADLRAAVDAAMVASRALLGIVARSIEPVQDRVTLPQLRVLVLLDTLGPSRSGALAERLGVHPSTFSRTADRLVAAGFVRRFPSPNSRREVLVTLTAKGKRLVASVLERRARLFGQVLDPLSPAQRREIIAGLNALAAAAGEPGAEDAAASLGA
jgi:DNA-binding MarR family transcriptional regulator